MNNYGFATWSDIVAAITLRVEQNKARLLKKLTDEQREILNRIAQDDEQRLVAAQQWVAYHGT